ncbi:type II toxin-antitoxin system RatA family toxin [Thiobacillus sedimenti]|uniref:Type II toxin-antitoxin system RatA family toxin n=1 Tax=Thiobacillus sedimenti TaxID=3110231 RepID=A0ABZ1CJ09_9PROT|nr:type II toxin-antitoxin system RatA family toxin [Thiobacillus sp. SCUT-2]WRS38292.1 type II toxin-antitoxin system RatA family toxin [Thiobacillus sp. SCUT-2]
MARVEKSVLVAHPPERMFELVDRVEDYPDFLPWCGGTELKLRDAQCTVATIHIAYMGIRQSFTTENTKTYPREMRIRLRDGPFSHLEGDWTFLPLGEDACKVEFRLQYVFSSRMLETVLAPVFSHITNTFVDAFVRRADEVYAA